MRFSACPLLLLLVTCTSLRPVPAAWQRQQEAARIADLCGRVTCAPKSASEVKIDHGRLTAGGKALTPEFKAIDSFDVSLERREVVFSAKRNDNFDIGLVSLDGSDIHWLPEDPADETKVQWAPSGNKVSYIIRTRSGDLVRTVHIPTAVQLLAEFPYATVRELGWEPGGERYSVVVSSPEASERIESLKYGGEGRQTVVAPAVRLDAAIEPFDGGIVLRPGLLRYGERLPLVVWISSQPFEWNDARGALMHDHRIASAIIDRDPDDAFWSAVSAMPWIDGSRVFVVWSGGLQAAGADRRAEARRSTIYILPADDLPAGRYRVRNNVIDVPRAIVESFASGWIAQQLKDRNGRR